MSAKVILMSMSICMILVAGLVALKSGTLTPKQMMEKYPGKFSFSFIANGAMGANLVLMSATLYVIGDYRKQWSDLDIGVALLLGLAVSFLLFEFVYRYGKFPDSLAGVEGR